MSESTNGKATETEMATFGAGCFWQVEEAFRKVDGVVDTMVGYEGGNVKGASYEQVCSGTTGHAEVVQVSFDPDEISYGELVQRFWKLHDPTQLDRQGLDVGSQYRSVIFTHSDTQREAAEASRASEQERRRKPIATSVEPASGFNEAEDYHQCYLEKRSAGGLMKQLFGAS